LIYLSRSSYETARECPRKAYWQYLYRGTGLVPRKMGLALAIGLGVHAVMEWVFGWYAAGQPEGPSEWDGIQAGVDEYDRCVAGYKGETNPFTIAKVDEGRLLVQALAGGWLTHRLTAFLEEFEVLSVEKEISALLAPGVTLNARADLVVRRKADGVVIVWNWKTTGNKSQWTRQWQNEIQVITEALAVEEDLGEQVTGVVMEGLYKGYSKEGVWQTPLLWGFEKDGSVTPKWANGAKKVSMWEGGKPNWNWISSLPREVVDAQFIRSDVIPKNNDVVRDWLAQVVHNARSDSYVLNLPVEAERERELHFWQKFGEACEFCQFKPVCKKETEMDELVKDGVLVERVDHHAQA
jgi:PD-(D/E)XK nuclease superfamily protein